VVRRYEEPIEVRAGAGEQGSAAGRDGQRASGQTAGESPSAFLWRGRLYVVRNVLAHWQERRPWWRDALDDAPAGAAEDAPGRDVLADARERHVWRVEASAGRMAGTGVYDLGADHNPRQWRLLRVAD
jgi:hypothetical protein